MYILTAYKDISAQVEPRYRYHLEYSKVHCRQRYSENQGGKDYHTCINHINISVFSWLNGSHLAVTVMKGSALSNLLNYTPDIMNLG